MLRVGEEEKKKEKEKKKTLVTINRLRCGGAAEYDQSFEIISVP